MSTRGAIGFHLKNKDYLTYNHSDSYPGGVGIDVLNEVCSIKNWNPVKTFVSHLTLVDENEKPSQKELNFYADYASTDISIRNRETWYSLLRECQGILMHYMTGNIQHMIDSNNFIKDSLFCEWAYIINLDSMELEIWKGFQHELDPNNRYGQEIFTIVGEAISKNTYYPCKLLLSFPLDNLPTRKDFLKWIEERVPQED